jgi:RNA polymerase sigma factor (sigma-70 family)
MAQREAHSFSLSGGGLTVQVSLRKWLAPPTLSKTHENSSTRAGQEPGLAHRSDPMLVQACIRGDKSAWRELVDRYAKLIYSIARRYGFSEADAGEVLQNVFVILLGDLTKLGDRTNLAAWLITTAFQEMTRIRDLILQRAEGRLELIGELVPLTEPELQSMTRRELLRQAIDRLTPTERALITSMFANPPPTHDELTARTGIPQGSIVPTRARSFSRLESILLEMAFEG